MSLETEAGTGTHVIPTLYVYESFAMPYQPGLLDAPIVRLTVPAVERETARDPIAWQQYIMTFVQLVAPYLPEWFAGWWGSLYFTESRMGPWYETFRKT